MAATQMTAPATVFLETRAPHPLRDRVSTQATMIDAVLSGHGITRVAELTADAAEAPVAIVVPRLGTAIWPEPAGGLAAPSALSDWVAARMRGRPAVVPLRVLAEVPIIFRGKLVGLVVLLDDGSVPGTDACEVLHLAALAVVMELAVEDAREEAEQRLRGSFLEDLRFRERLGAPELVRRAARLGCDLSRGGVILCATVPSDRSHLVATTIAAEHPGALAQQLGGSDEDGRPRFYAALPASVGDGSPAATVASARQLATRLGRKAIVGLSSFRADPAELGDALQEAELMLEVLHQSGGAMTDEVGGGTYTLLFRMLASHPEEIRAFYDASVAALVRYDERHRTELVRTLQAYLDANCNMNATAAAIFAHRHTVAYRLERIRDLSGLDPMLSEHRERLGLGLKVHRIVASD